MVLLRESKRKAEQSTATLQTNVHLSMTELQELHQDFQVIKCTAPTSFIKSVLAFANLCWPAVLKVKHGLNISSQDLFVYFRITFDHK